MLGVVVAFAIYGTFRVQKEREHIYAELARSAQERIDLIAQSVANLLVGYDYSNMESLVDRIVVQSDVKSVIVRNASGKVMASGQNYKASGDPSLRFEAVVLAEGLRVGSAELHVSTRRADEAASRVYFEVFAEEALFGLFVGTLLFFVTSRVIVRPVLRISDHMRDMLAGKDVGPMTDLGIDSQDEMGELARTFGSLNRKIASAQQQLRQRIDLAGSELMAANESLQQRSTELERRTRDLEKALGLVERLAVTDSLTDLRNRRYFDDSLASAFARAQRFGDCLCLLLLDVDHFKQINDSYGHAAGDLVLQTLAARFRERTRDTDIAARLGGDEFAFLLFRAEHADGVAFGEAMLAIARAAVFHFDGQEVRVGVSIGVACVNDEVRSIESLYGAADDALYEAKRRGRNQVVGYPFDSAAARRPKRTQRALAAKENV